mmetsp:Transcript_39265/g.45034  ORF Transcript_39265/g.45034 Transcript_39265/m.45034 type:complete len:171 (+) Transcript_39265:880-1392(+)
MNEKIGSFCIGDHTIVGANSSIENACVGSSCNIAENCRIVESIVWNNVKIGANSDIINCIVIDNVVIEPGSQYRNKLLINSGDKNAPKLNEYPIEFTYRTPAVDDKGHESEESDLFDEESEEDEVEQNKNNFGDEVRSVIVSKINEGGSAEDIKFEIKSLKFSYDKNFSE